MTTVDSLPVDYVPELRAHRPWIMEEMVAAEPSLVTPILASTEPARAIAELIAKAVGTHSTVVLTGCGTSETAAMAVAGLIVNALPADRRGFVHVRQALEASLDPWPGGLCIGISHEGSTRATILALEAARRAGSATALITARAAAPAANVADAMFVTPMVDRSWCHTVGYLSPILAGAAVAQALGAPPVDSIGLEAALLDNTIGPQAATLAERLWGFDRLVITAAGPARSAARELALKIEEGVWLPARMLELETMLHGHLAACDAKTGIVLIATDPNDRLTARSSVVIEAARRIGVRVGAIVSSLVDARLDAADRIVLPSALEAHGLVGRLSGTALALQHLALALASRAGTNPDLIRRQEEPYREAARVAESATDW